MHFNRLFLELTYKQVSELTNSRIFTLILMWLFLELTCQVSKWAQKFMQLYM